MSKYTNTLDQAFTFKSLHDAAHDCMKGVAWKECVSKWMTDQLENLAKLKDELDSGTYAESEPYVFQVTDPKPRSVTAIPFRDRVVQRSLCNNGVYELLTRPLIYDNCACQKGKGVTFAIKRLEHHLRAFYRETGSNRGWVVRLDIRKYFPSIPHKILKAKLKDVITDTRAYELICMVIDDAVKIKSDADISFCSPDFGLRGIGLGSQLSQLMALHYLSPLDHYLKEKLRIKHYLRYMDDMIMFVRTRAEAEELFKVVAGYIAPLGLHLNPKSHICRIDQPLEFLKMLYTLTATGKVKHRIVRKALNKEVRMINSLCRQFKENKIPFSKLLQHTNTWFGYAKHRASRNQIKYIRDLLKKNFEGFEKIELKAA